MLKYLDRHPSLLVLGPLIHLNCTKFSKIQAFNENRPHKNLTAKKISKIFVNNQKRVSKTKISFVIPKIHMKI